MAGLKLEKYLSEAASNIAENKPRNAADLLATVEIVALLCNRFPDFSGLVLPLFRALVSPPPLYQKMGVSVEQKEKEEAVRIPRQRSALKFLAEFFFVGVVPFSSSQKQDDLLFSRVLVEMLSTDKELVNVSIVASFLKSYDYVIFTERIPQEIQQQLERTLGAYYTQLHKAILSNHKQLKSMEKQNKEFQLVKGELSDEKIEKQRNSAKSLDRLLAAMNVLAPALGKELPDFGGDDDDVAQEDRGIGISTAGPNVRVEGDPGIWDDEETRNFYEDLIDLKNYVPPGLLGSRPETSEAITEDITDTLAEDDSKEADLQNEILDHKEHDLDQSKDQMESNEPKKEISSSTQASLEALFSRMLHALNRDSIDQIAVDFVYVNSKAARNKLVQNIIAVPRSRTDLLPYFARLIATLNMYFPDIGTSIVDSNVPGQIEERLKTVKFIGELVKFKVAPSYVAFTSIQKLLDQFHGLHIEALCALLETCGLFLVRTPELNQKAMQLLDVLMKKKAAAALEQRLALMVENAYYASNPPDRAAIQTKEREPLELYLHHLLYKVLEYHTSSHVLVQIRKFPWNEEKTYKMLLKGFIRVWKVKFSSIQCCAWMVYELSKVYPSFGLQVVDAALEELRQGMEFNLFKQNQRRISVVKYIGELYNYRFTRDGGVPRPDLVSPIDAPHDFFRVRLACTLLETTGKYLSSGPLARKLDETLVFLQLYINSKWSLPLEIEFLVEEMFDIVRPGAKRFWTYADAAVELNSLVSVDQTVSEDQSVAGDDDRDESQSMHSDQPDLEIEQQLDEEEDDDDVIVENQETEVAQEEIDAFDAEFAKLLAESLDSRRFERKGTFDVAVPVVRSILGNNSGTVAQEQVEFALLTKKGNKATVKKMALPVDSQFVQSTREKQELEIQEKQRMKQIVLDYEARGAEDELARLGKNVALNVPLSQKEKKKLAFASRSNQRRYR